MHQKKHPDSPISRLFALLWRCQQTNTYIKTSLSKMTSPNTKLKCVSTYFKLLIKDPQNRKVKESFSSSDTNGATLHCTVIFTLTLSLKSLLIGISSYCPYHLLFHYMCPFLLPSNSFKNLTPWNIIIKPLVSIKEIVGYFQHMKQEKDKGKGGKGMYPRKVTS